LRATATGHCVAGNSILSRCLTPKCRDRDSLLDLTARGGLMSVLGSLRISRTFKT
jgi:hypothetical protein